MRSPLQQNCSLCEYSPLIGNSFHQYLITLLLNRQSFQRDFLRYLNSTPQLRGTAVQAPDQLQFRLFSLIFQHINLIKITPYSRETVHFTIYKYRSCPNKEHQALHTYLPGLFKHTRAQKDEWRWFMEVFTELFRIPWNMHYCTVHLWKIFWYLTVLSPRLSLLKLGSYANMHVQNPSKMINLKGI